MSTSIIDRATMHDALRIAGLSQPNRGGFCRCPFHDDDKPSLHLVGPKGRETGYRCFACSAAGGILDFLVGTNVAADHSHAAQILEERISEARLQTRVVASYAYDDGAGQVIARIDRIEPARNGRDKEFLPYLTIGNSYAEKSGLNGTRLPLYRRNEVLKSASEAGTVFLVEGEGKADALRDALRAAGSTAAVTTIANGATAPMRDDHVADFAGAKRVVVIPDSDVPGRTAAQSRARRIAAAHRSADVRLVDLYPGAQDGSDVANWLAQGHTITELRRLTAIAQAVDPDAVPADTNFPSSAAREQCVLSAADLLNSPEDHIDYLIDCLLPKGGILLLAGKPKCGKSVLARNLALAACRGSTFLGRRVEKTTVLWLCLEETRAQVSAAFRAMGMRQDDAVHFFFGHAAGDAHAWLQRTCEEVDAGLVVIDTWHKLTLIESVNDYGAVNRANQPLQQLAREKGIAQVWIHHSNKGVARNGSEVLGSQALFAAVDTLASMDRSEDGTRTIWTIQRSGEDLEPTVVTMNDDQLISIAGTKRENELARAEQRILDSLGDDPMPTKELKDGAGVRSALFWSALGSLAQKGFIRREGRGTAVEPYRYRLGNQDPVSGTNTQTVVPIVPRYNREPRELGSQSSGTNAELDGTSGTTGTSGIAGTSADDLLDYACESLGQ